MIKSKTSEEDSKYFGKGRRVLKETLHTGSTVTGTIKKLKEKLETDANYIGPYEF